MPIDRALAITVLIVGLAPSVGLALPSVDRNALVPATQPFTHKASAAAIKCRARNLPRLAGIENKVLAFKTKRPIGTALPPNLAFNQRSARNQFNRCVQQEKLREHRKRFKY